MKRILSLDTGPLIADSLCAALTDAGYEALATSSVHEALLILRTQSVDLITIGLGSRDILPSPSLRGLLPSELFKPSKDLPLMNGEEFLRLLKDDEDLRHVPVLLVTAYPKARAAQLLQQFGLNIGRDVVGYVDKGSKEFGAVLVNAVASALNTSGGH